MIYSFARRSRFPPPHYLQSYRTASYSTRQCALSSSSLTANSRIKSNSLSVATPTSTATSTHAPILHLTAVRTATSSSAATLEAPQSSPSESFQPVFGSDHVQFNSFTTSSPSSDPFQSLPSTSTPIILPPLTPKSHLDPADPNLPSSTTRRKIQVMKLQEQLAVMHASIQSGNMHRAERIFNFLWNNYKDDMREILNTNVYNVFLDGWLNVVVDRLGSADIPADVENPILSPNVPTGEVKKALKEGLVWFQKMKLADVTPDATSYASVLRALLLARQQNDVAIFVQEIVSVDRSREFSKSKLRSKASKKPPVASSSSGKMTLLHRVLSHPYILHGLGDPEKQLLSRVIDTVVPKNMRKSIGGVNQLLAEEIQNDLNPSADPMVSAPTNEELSNIVEKELSAIQDSQAEYQQSANVSSLTGQPSISELPEPTPVNSVGVRLLKQHMSPLASPSSSSNHAQINDSFSLYSLQLKLEEEAYTVALERLREEVAGMASASAGGSGGNSKSLIMGSRNSTLKKYMWDWYQGLTKSLENEIEKVKSGVIEPGTDRDTYGPFLTLLPPSQLSIITILEILRHHQPVSLIGQTSNERTDNAVPEGAKVNKAVISIGAAVEAEVNAVAIRKKRAQLAKQKKQSNQKYYEQIKNASSPGDVSNIADGHAASLISDSGAVDLPSPTDAWLNHYLSERVYNNQRIFNMTVRKLYGKLQQAGDTVHAGEGGSVSTDGLLEGSWIRQWPQSVRAKVGSVLLSLLMENSHINVTKIDPATGVKIVERVPAFYHTYAYQNGKRIGIIRFHSHLSELMSRDPLRETLHAKLLPMLVPPRPWLTYTSGGYLNSRQICMRVKDNNPEQSAYLRAAAKQNRLDFIHASLDVLGSTPWKINKDVLKVVLDAWNSGEELADIPKAWNDEEVKKWQPMKPSDYDSNPVVRWEYQRKSKEFNDNVRNSFSVRCDTNYKIEIARTFADQTIYFPHNIDFRGRAYPIPVYLNHIGSDLCRGLLMFAKAKPLGERGWGWLRVHLANIHGYDKASFADRQQWVMDNMENVMDSADNPLTGKRWWLKADDPWQCLATCFEITKAVRSGNPLTFHSHLPVHQDGTCNGLQHYAALGGDVLGAAQVNLIASDKPADVYTGVADLVAKSVSEDAAKGIKHAELLDGKITRKVVKQTVMTNVYGVTFIGARIQIENRLKETGLYDTDQIYSLSGYLTKKVFSSIGEVFQGSQKIQDWLINVAKRVARSVPKEWVPAENIHDPMGVLKKNTLAAQVDGETAEDARRRKVEIERKRLKESEKNNKGVAPTMTSVIWTTPLGLPCVQPYRRENKKQIKTLLQTVYLSDPNNPAPVNVTKQASAFPPNFIHSLDASHMMLTAISCHRSNLTFASVHDSYWTHAADVDQMNEIIRDEFVRLHSQPIMQNLKREFEMRYGGFVIPVEVRDKLDDVWAKLNEEEDGGDNSETRGVGAERERKAKSKVDGGKKKKAVKSTTEELNDDDDTIAGEITITFDDEEDTNVENKKTKSKAKNNDSKKTNLWVPLELPELPPRGEFDVSKVKESAYFFH